MTMLDQRRKLAIKLQNDTIELCRSLLTDYPQMSETVREVLCMYALNATDEQVAEAFPQYSFDTVRRYRYRYKDILRVCTDHLTDQYHLHKFL